MTVWSAKKTDDSLKEKVKNLWSKANPGNDEFKFPYKRTKFNLTHLIFMGWVKMEELPNEKRLFATFDEALDFFKSYSKTRNPNSHEFTDGLDKNWIEHRPICEHLFRKLQSALCISEEELTLPPIRKIVTEAIEVVKSS